MNPLGSPGGSAVKTLPANAEDVGLTRGWGKSPGKGNGHPLQYSFLGNPMDMEPDRLKSMRMQRVGCDLVTKQQQFQNAFLFLLIPVKNTI